MTRIIQILTLGLIVLLFAACEKDNNNTTNNNSSTWAKAYFSYGSGIHKAADILALPNNDGYLILGSYQRYSSTDISFYLVKADTAGTVIWQNIYGTTGYENIPKRVKLMTSGDYLLIGDRLGTQSEMQLMKISTAGALVSSATLTIAAGENEWAADAVEDAAGNILITGTTSIVNQKPETQQYGSFDLSDITYYKLDASFNVIGKFTRGFVGEDQGVACFSLPNEYYMVAEESPRTGNAPTFGKTPFASAIRNDNLQEVWFERLNDTMDVLVKGATIEPYSGLHKITRLGQKGQLINLSGISTDGMTVGIPNDINSALSGTIEVKSIEVMSNGQYLVSTILTNASDRNVHTLIIDSNYNLVAEFSTGSASEQETVARAIPANGYNVFVADVANAYTQAPSQFVNEPDTIVLGIAQ